MPENTPPRDEIERLRARLDLLEQEVQQRLREQAKRLGAIEHLLRAGGGAPSNTNDLPPVLTHTSTSDESRAETSPPIETPSNEATNAPHENFFSNPATRFNDRTQEPARKKSDLETRIGGKWFNWIGIIALCFGVAFILKSVFDNNLIGITGRILLGGAGGVALLVGAERLRARGYATYSYGLTGGGILILYLSIYAAFGFYGLITQTPAFLLMVLVTTTAVLLAARNNAQTIAILGLIGGFLTPILLSTGTDNEIGLFTYIALLDAGVLALAYFKSWRSLNHMAFMATVLMFFGWYLAWYPAGYVPSKLWLTCFFLTVFFLLFVTLAVFHNLLPQRRANWFDLSLVIAMASFYFGTIYELLDDAGYHDILGSFAVLMSAFYALLFYAAHKLHRPERLLRLAYLNAAIIFFTLAIAIQLNQNWITIGWALEGLTLTYIGLRTEMRAARFAALAVFFVAVARWLGFDLYDVSHRAMTLTPFINRRVVSCAILVASLFLAAWLHQKAITERTDEKDTADDEIFPAVLFIAAHALILTAVSVEVYDRMRGSFLAQQLSLSLIWTIYGGALLVVGLVRQNKLLRGMALALLGLTILKVFLLDLSSLDNIYRIISFIVLAAILLVVSFLYQQRQRKEDRVENDR